MIFRAFSFLIILFLCASCDKFSFTKRHQTQAIDTIVDFSLVDTFPSFKNCDSIFDATQKADCFRKTIHFKIGKELQQYSFKIKDSISSKFPFEIVLNKSCVFFSLSFRGYLFQPNI